MAVILAIAAITLVFAVQLPYIRLQASVYEVAIEDLPENLYFQEIREQFGAEEIIRVVLRADDVFSPEVFERIGVLSDRLGAINGVVEVISLTTVKERTDLLDEWSPGEFEEIIKPVRLFTGNLTTPEGGSTAITLLIGDIDREERIVREIERILGDEREYSLYQIGMPVFSQALLQNMKRDFSRLPPLTFILMVLVLVVIFRRPRVAAAPIACILVAFIWTFGAMAWADKPVSILTLIVPVFLMAVGTAYCMHVVSEYLHVANQATSREEAAYITLRHMRLPGTLAVATTVIGLASLLVNRVDAIRDFAIPACVGMLSLLLLILTLFPAILALIPLPATSKMAPDEGWVDRFLRRVSYININHRGKVLALVAVGCIVAASGILRIKVETNPCNYIREDSSVFRNFHDIYKDLSGSFPVNVIIDGREPGYFGKLENLRNVSEFQDFLLTVDGVDKAVSVIDYIRMMHYSTQDYEPEEYRLPDDQAMVPHLINSYWLMLGKDMSTRFLNTDLSRANIVLMTHISSSHDWLVAERTIREQWRNRFAEDFDMTPTSIGVVIAHSNRMVTRGQLKSLLLTVLLVVAMMFFIFRSFRVGVLSFAPNSVPIVVNFGIMGWLGIELSMNTGLIASIAIGLAIDDTIHYMVRYRRELTRQATPEKAMTATLRTVGRPIVYTTITISLGFSVLLMSSFKPTAMFGGLMVCTMLTALVADLFVLPNLLLHSGFEARRTPVPRRMRGRGPGGPGLGGPRASRSPEPASEALLEDTGSQGTGGAG